MKATLARYVGILSLVALLSPLGFAEAAAVSSMLRAANLPVTLDTTLGPPNYPRPNPPRPNLPRPNPPTPSKPRPASPQPAPPVPKYPLPTPRPPISKRPASPQPARPVPKYPLSTTPTPTRPRGLTTLSLTRMNAVLFANGATQGLFTGTAAELGKTHVLTLT